MPEKEKKFINVLMSTKEQFKMYLDDEFVERLKSLATRFGDRTGTSYQNVHHHLKYLGVELRKNGGIKRRPRFARKLLNSLYVKQRMSMSAVGRELGVSADVVKRDLDRYGISSGRSRQRSPAAIALQKNAVKLYEKGWSVKQIADRFRKHPQTIYKELARAGVELRYKTALRRTFADLRRLYVAEKMPVRKICRTLGITRARLLNELIRQKIPLRSLNGPIRYPELAILKVGESAILPRSQKRSYHKPFFDDARRVGIRIKVKTIDENSVRVFRI